MENSIKVTTKNKITVNSLYLHMVRAATVDSSNNMGKHVPVQMDIDLPVVRAIAE